MTFKEFHDKNMLGVREVIRLTKFPDIGEIAAKVDTGNEAYNVLHGTDVQDKGDTVTFKTVGNHVITLSKVNTIKIHIGSGVKEDRPVVKLDFNLNGKEYHDMPFSIADRSENEEAVLIGEPFLRKTNSVVDASKV
jgi:hypothetical protein